MRTNLSLIAAFLICALAWFALPAFAPQIFSQDAFAQGGAAAAPAKAAPGAYLSCQQQTWPYYAAKCLSDAKDPTVAPRAVRLVTTDRLAADPRYFTVR